MPHAKHLRRLAAVLATAAVTTVAHVAVPSNAAAFTSMHGVRLNAVEARLTTLINHARTSRGIPALTVAPGTTDLARAWAMNQASKNTLYHNPALVAGVEGHGSGDWRAVSENVGRGWDAASLFQAYMNSPSHRANILDRSVRYLGIGWVERPDGSGYNTQVFVDRYSTAYGRTRRAAVGGLGDVRTPTSPLALATFENGWDPRVMLVRSGTGIVTGGPYFPVPGAGDQSVRFAVRETRLGTGGGAQLRLRDSLDLRHASAIRVKLSSVTDTGRSVRVVVGIRRELGSHVVLGTVTVPSGGRFVTATLPLPSSTRNFRNAITISVTRSALHSLSGLVSKRGASVRVSDVSVLA
ncbi:MAG TPA: CAP domain-containing protein [Frankiaceae bacterium]|nr:CAP domain-containing protein [Frankiaceae bacterium]